MMTGTRRSLMLCFRSSFRIKDSWKLRLGH
jgi:hypothetical protein